MLSNRQADYGVHALLPMAPVDAAIATEVARDEASLAVTQTPRETAPGITSLPGPPATLSPTPTASPTLLPTSAAPPPPSPPALTATPALPTPTPAQSTATPVSPTATPISPTATPVPPTVTPVPPTATPVVPTTTPVPATTTPAPPPTSPPDKPPTNTPTNQPPLVAGDNATVVEDLAVLIDVLANDQDTDGVIVPGTLAIVIGPARGAVVVTTQIAYSPAPNFSGQDTFVYRVCDNNNACGTAMVTVTVLPQDDDPVAVADTYTTAEDTPLVIAAPGVLANDINVDPGDILEARFPTGPSSGSALTLNADGSFRYTPLNAFEGVDNFTYRACDQGGDRCSDPVVVTIWVSPVNHEPVAQDDETFTIAGTEEVISVLSNDSDLDGDILTIIEVSYQGSGSVINNGSSITYSPDPNFAGDRETFTYTISDGNGGTATATVTIFIVAG